MKYYVLFVIIKEHLPAEIIWRKKMKIKQEMF